MYGQRIDPHIMRALPSIIPPYPPGATVKLSDGTTATVIEFTRASRTTRPSADWTAIRLR
jgi:hypothetical protein